MYRVSLQPTTETTSKSSSEKLLKSGIALHGESLTANTVEWTSSLVPYLKEDGVCSLSDILVMSGNIPLRYYLSKKACQGIIRRSELREKVLPPVLKLALENQINEEKNPIENNQYSGFNFELWSGECKNVSPTLTRKRAEDTFIYNDTEKTAICYENHAQDSRVKNMGEVCQNLTARMGTGGGNLPLVQEISSMAFEPGIAQREGGESRFTDEFVGTLRSNAGDNQHAVAIVEKNQECFNIATCDANGTRKDRPNGGLYITKADASKTISTGGLGNETVVVNEIIALDGDKIAKKERKGGSGFGINEDNVMYTQTAKDVHAVAYVQCVVDMMGGKAGCHISSEDVSPTITSGRGSASDVHSIAYGETEKIRTTATVRRLLPVECERLMGFPDNHTQIEWKGKKLEDCPDAPRYKACGNSMCVNVMRWIGMQIDEIEKNGLSDF
jgi:hypothetical protein